MIDYDEQILFEAAKLRVADMVSTMVEEEPNPALAYAAMMSHISGAITADGFWGSEPPDFFDLRGFWTLMHRLQEKVFADLGTEKGALSHTTTS